MARMNRDFSYKGIAWHLNDNTWRNEFESKYQLLYWHEGHGAWMRYGCVDTKKEAIETVRDLFADRCYPYL